MLTQTIRHFLERHAIAPGLIGVAVSGGADSTALLIAAAELRHDGFEIVAIHVNHHLRGDESIEDERFVRDLCRSLGVVLHVVDGTLDDAAVRDTGIEAAARAIRYARLSELAGAHGLRWIATAHQKDDQAETVLMRLRHRSGVGGLRGIQPVRVDGFIRPLLEVRRSEIEAFLHEKNIAPRRDHSNDDHRFERNRVRAVLRSMEGSDDLVESLAQIACEAEDIWPAIEEAITAAEAAHVVDAAGDTRFVSWPGEPWLREAMLRRAIRRLDPTARDVSQHDLERLTGDVDGITRVDVTRNVEIFRDDATLVLRRKRERQNEAYEVTLAAGDTAVIGSMTVALRRIDSADVQDLRRQARRDRARGDAALHVIQLPREAGASFVVRSRRPGDRFQPLGMSAPKRLKEVLIDRRIPAELRDRIPLLVCNGEIACVVGVEVSERYKVTSPAGVLYEVRMEVSGAGDDDDSHAHVHR